MTRGLLTMENELISYEVYGINLNGGESYIVRTNFLCRDRFHAYDVLLDKYGLLGVPLSMEQLIDLDTTYVESIDLSIYKEHKLYYDDIFICIRFIPFEDKT